MKKYTAAAIAAMIFSMNVMSQPAFAEALPAAVPETTVAVSGTTDSESNLYTFEELLAMSDEEISAISETHAEILDYGHDSSAILWSPEPTIEYQLCFLDASKVLQDDPFGTVDKEALLELLALPNDVILGVAPWIDYANIDGEVYERITICAALYTYEDYDAYRVQRTMDVLLKTNSEIDLVYAEYWGESEVSPSETNGEVTGVSLYGDVDCDGMLSITDVIALNKNLMLGEPITEQGERNADVDGNGELNATDSLNILKAVVKLIELPSV